MKNIIKNIYKVFFVKAIRNDSLRILIFLSLLILSFSWIFFVDILVPTLKLEEMVIENGLIEQVNRIKKGTDTILIRSDNGTRSIYNYELNNKNYSIIKSSINKHAKIYYTNEINFLLIPRSMIKQIEIEGDIVVLYDYNNEISAKKTSIMISIMLCGISLMILFYVYVAASSKSNELNTNLGGVR